MPHELPIKSKFLVFEYDDKEDTTFIFNKKTNEYLGVIYKPTKKSSYWFEMEKGISFDERCLRNTLACIEHMKKVKL